MLRLDKAFSPEVIYGERNLVLCKLLSYRRLTNRDFPDIRQDGIAIRWRHQDTGEVEIRESLPDWNFNKLDIQYVY